MEFGRYETSVFSCDFMGTRFTSFLFFVFEVSRLSWIFVLSIGAGGARRRSSLE